MLPIPVQMIALSGELSAEQTSSWAAFGIDVEAVKATDGRSQMPDLEGAIFDPVSAYRILGRQMSAAEVGCFISHRKIWQYMIDNDIKRLLILEEDAVPKTGVREVIEACLRLPQDSFGLLYLQRTKEKRVAPIGNLTASIALYESLGRGSYSNLSYIIERKAAQRFLDYSKVIDAPVDFYIELRWKHRLPVYEVRPYVVVPKGTTTINESRKVARSQSALKPVQKVIGRIAKLWRSIKRFTSNASAALLLPSSRPLKRALAQINLEKNPNL